MPNKKKKFPARFPPARIKQIMQSDDNVGKVAQVVPVLMSQALESFLYQLLDLSSQVTRSRNARTLTPQHLKECIYNEPQFAFLKQVVANVKDVSKEQSASERGEGGQFSGHQ